MAKDIGKVINNLPRTFNRLCAPAQIYLVISLLSFVALILQNGKNKNQFRCGPFSKSCPFNNNLFFLFQFVFILVFTWVLDTFCGNRYSIVSWVVVFFLILLPIAGMILALMGNMFR